MSLVLVYHKVDNLGLCTFLGIVGVLGVNRFGERPTLMLGALIATVGCFTSSFATNIYFLIVTYGLIFGRHQN